MYLQTQAMDCQVSQTAFFCMKVFPKETGFDRHYKNTNDLEQILVSFGHNYGNIYWLPYLFPVTFMKLFHRWSEGSIYASLQKYHIKTF